MSEEKSKSKSKSKPNSILSSGKTFNYSKFIFFKQFIRV